MTPNTKVTKENTDILYCNKTQNNVEIIIIIIIIIIKQCRTIEESEGKQVRE
jgi:hypothetical protein